jgi:glycosyltransferase involved in cell wall biosynthesis
LTFRRAFNAGHSLRHLVRLVIPLRWCRQLTTARLSSLLGLPPATEWSVSLGGRRVELANPLFEICDEDIAASRRGRPIASSVPRSVTWFVPWWRHLAFGGIHTIFLFAADFAGRGVHTRLVIYDNPEADLLALRSQVVRSFPALTYAEFESFDFDSNDINSLPATDIAICTYWASAYLLLKFQQTSLKYYFVQDYEPYFYVPGPVFALAESTYRFGFRGIVNTPGLLDVVRARHGMEGISFVPAVDERYFHPAPSRPSDGRLRVFFYARPGQPRNGFALGVLVIRDLLDRYGDRIEVITAGGDWDERDFGLAGRITNLGLLPGLQAVGDLYRTCDIGFVYSLTKHPSYQPFEFMATGMATVTNRNEDTMWLLDDGVNCLLAEPSPSAMAQMIGSLIEDAQLRDRIAHGGVAGIRSGWAEQLAHVWRYVTGGS